MGQANVKKLRESYKTLVGKVSDKPMLPEKKIKEPSTLEISVRGGIENDIALKILTLEERALRAELSSIEKSQLPNLSLSGSLSYGDSQTLGNNISSGRISLTSSLTLYSGGQEKARDKIASNK